MRALLAMLLVGVAAFMSMPAARAAEIGLEGIEVRAGLASPEDDAGSTIVISGSADLGTLAPNFGLEVGVDFWTKSWDIDGWEADWSYSYTNFGFLGTVRYEFPTEGNLLPYAFGGLGLHLWSWSHDFEGTGSEYWGDTDGSDIEFGLHFGAGAELEMSPTMNLAGRAGYNTNGGLDYLFIQAGVKFLMGK